jgi:hypothetical protein
MDRVIEIRELYYKERLQKSRLKVKIRVVMVIKMKFILRKCVKIY